MPFVEGDDAFFLTYGDGLGNINVGQLLEFHRGHGQLATMTAVSLHRGSALLSSRGA